MKIGLLWYDNSNLPLETKIRNAVKHYQDKFGTTPNKIYVHPKDYMDCNDFNVQSSKSIMKNHIWVGIEDK